MKKIETVRKLSKDKTVEMRKSVQTATEAQEQVREAAIQIVEDMVQVHEAVRNATKALRKQAKQLESKLDELEYLVEKVNEIEKQSRITKSIQFGIYVAMLIAGAMLFLALELWQPELLKLVVKAFNALH